MPCYSPPPPPETLKKRNTRAAYFRTTPHPPPPPQGGGTFAALSGSYLLLGWHYQCLAAGASKAAAARAPARGRGPLQLMSRAWRSDAPERAPRSPSALDSLLRSVQLRLPGVSPSDQTPVDPASADDECCGVCPERLLPETQAHQLSVPFLSCRRRRGIGLVMGGAEQSGSWLAQSPPLSEPVLGGSPRSGAWARRVATRCFSAPRSRRRARAASEVGLRRTISGGGGGLGALRASMRRPESRRIMSQHNASPCCVAPQVTRPTPMRRRLRLPLAGNRGHGCGRLEFTRRLHGAHEAEFRSMKAL